MRAMILAAGWGSRMGALTAHLPKPLLKVNHLCLIEHLLIQLKQAGISEIVINVSYLADLICTTLGEGERYGVNLQYSYESLPLGWGGGILQALPLLGKEPFLAISADIWTDYPFETLSVLPEEVEAHFILVQEPDFKPDFGLFQERVCYECPTYTYANIGLFRPTLFEPFKRSAFSQSMNPLHPMILEFSPVLHPSIFRGRVRGECYKGVWFNVGTPHELKRLQEYVRDSIIE